MYQFQTVSGGKHFRVFQEFMLCCFFFLPPSQDSETNRGEYEKKRNTRDLSREISEDSDVFGT